MVLPVKGTTISVSGSLFFNCHQQGYIWIERTAIHWYKGGEKGREPVCKGKAVEANGIQSSRESQLELWVTGDQALLCLGGLVLF
jgi:hypothetical protein